MSRSFARSFGEWLSFSLTLCIFLGLFTMHTHTQTRTPIVTYSHIIIQHIYKEIYKPPGAHALINKMCPPPPYPSHTSIPPPFSSPKKKAARQYRSQNQRKFSASHIPRRGWYAAPIFSDILCMDLQIHLYITARTPRKNYLCTQCAVAQDPGPGPAAEMPLAVSARPEQKKKSNKITKKKKKRKLCAGCRIPRNHFVFVNWARGGTVGVTNRV